MILDVDSLGCRPDRPTAYAAGRVKCYLVVACVCLAFAGCASLPKNTVDEMLLPSNDRPWKASMAVLPHARVRGDKVKVYNVRNCTYLDEDTYVLNYEDRTYDLDDLDSLDFIMSPFEAVPSLAHTFLSFGFRDGSYLSVSVEVRLEEGEVFSIVGGLARQFEIMYVIADERDLIKLRTEVRGSEVYIYRSRASYQQIRELFVDVMKRVNTLKKHPEFYDAFVNNCTTNIVAHINHIRPGTVPWDPTGIVTGYSDRTAYALGFLVDYGSFEETKRRARVTDLAHRYANDIQFSQMIRSDQVTTRLVERDEPDIAR